jgi:rRNA maturation RNase YbeY
LEASDSIEITHVHPELRLDERKILHLIARICTREKVALVDLGIVLADHRTVRDLNRSYLNHDYETDVLSFPLNDPEAAGVVEGEVYVDLDTALERHEEFDVSFEREALRYIAHGLLHLAGYGDKTRDQKAVMRRLEDRYLTDIFGS